MNSRRRFAKSLVWSALLPSFFSNLSAQNLPALDDWESIRAQFPLRKDATYFNNGTIGPSPYSVIDAVQERMLEIDRDWRYSGWNKIKGPLADFLGCKADELALTHNTTEGINIVAQGLDLASGDEVIMTTQEHAGNSLPWLNRARRDGIELKLFDPQPRADEVLNQVADLISKKTKVIAMPHISCIDGRAFPVTDIGVLAKEKGLVFMIDGAHGPGSSVLELDDIPCDFYASCGHKWMLGPKGTGFLYVAEDSTDLLDPIFTGGLALKEMNWVLDNSSMGEWAEGANRFDFATQNVGLYFGLQEAASFLDKIGMEKVEKRTRQLSGYLQEKLLEASLEVQMHSPMEPKSRGPMIGFKVANMNFRDVAKSLRPDFRIREVPEAGFDMLRVSCHIYNSEAEIDAFVKALENLN